MARTPPAIRICGARNVIFIAGPPSPSPSPSQEGEGFEEFLTSRRRIEKWFIRLPSGSPGGVRMTLALSGREGWGHARRRTLPPSAGTRRAVDRAVCGAERTGQRVDVWAGHG